MARTRCCWPSGCLAALALAAAAVAAPDGVYCGPGIPPEYCCDDRYAGEGYQPARMLCAYSCVSGGVQMPMATSCSAVDANVGFNASDCIPSFYPPGACTVYEFAIACDDPPYKSVCFQFQQAIANTPHTVDRSQGYANAFDVVHELNTSSQLPGSKEALYYTDFILGAPGVRSFLYSATRKSACGNVGPNKYKAGCTCADQLQISQCGKFEACKAFDAATHEACCTSGATRGATAAGNGSASCL